MDVSEIEKTVPEVTGGRGSPMLRGNVDKGTVGIGSRSEERTTRAAIGGESGRSGSKVRSDKSAVTAVDNRLTDIPELVHLGRGIDIFA
jgi:hypothetical protein